MSELSLFCMSTLARVLRSRTHISDVAKLGHPWTSCHDSLILGCYGVMGPLLSPHCLAQGALVNFCNCPGPQVLCLVQSPREWPLDGFSRHLHSTLLG